MGAEHLQQGAPHSFRQCPRHASSSECPACLLHALSLPGAHYCLGSERLWLAWVIVARGFRETLEILFRFSKKPASITVEVANPLSGRGRASVCPLATAGRNSEALVSRRLLPVPEGKEPPSLRWKRCDPDGWDIVWDWPESTRVRDWPSHLPVP